MRALSLFGRLRVMIAILPWVDRVICSSKVVILSSLSTAGRKDTVRDVHGIDTD